MKIICPKCLETHETEDDFLIAGTMDFYCPICDRDFRIEIEFFEMNVKDALKNLVMVVKG